MFFAVFMERLQENYDGEPERKIVLQRRGDTLEIAQERSVAAKRSFVSFLVSVFLPQGFPDSVSDDYPAYQLFDTVQAFASSMTGALATEAVLRGAGVGNENASVLAASLSWLVKDGLGMVGRIIFTYFKGTDLDNNPKKWRFMADVLNDFAFFLDLLSSSYPSIFLPLVCTSSLCRCVVGVAGGATRTTIVQHQAIRNNLADVAAKDGSQETLVNVVALISSLVLLPLVSGHTVIIWILYSMFTVIHLWANYGAVKCLHFKTLNQQRAIIVIREFLKSGVIPMIDECNVQEPLFEDPRRSYGCSLKKLAQYSGPTAEIVETENYIILFNRQRNYGLVAISTAHQNKLLPLFHLEAIAMRRPFTLDSFYTFVDLLGDTGYSSSTAHVGYDYWTYRQDL